MASVRYLKKEIKHFTSLIIEDCLLTSLKVHDKKDEIEQLMVHILSKRGELLKKAGEKKQSKEQYSAIKADLISTIEDTYQKLTVFAKQ